MLCTYWGFVLMSLHAGAHLLPVAAKLKKKKGLFPVICLIAATVSICGVYAFFKRGFPGYMAGTTKFAFFDYNEPLVLFLLDHLAVMALFMTVGAVLAAGLTGKRLKSPTE